MNGSAFTAHLNGYVHSDSDSDPDSGKHEIKTIVQEHSELESESETKPQQQQHRHIQVVLLSYLVAVVDPHLPEDLLEARQQRGRIPVAIGQPQAAHLRRQALQPQVRLHAVGAIQAVQAVGANGGALLAQLLQLRLRVAAVHCNDGVEDVEQRATAASVGGGGAGEQALLQLAQGGRVAAAALL